MEKEKSDRNKRITKESSPDDNRGKRPVKPPKSSDGEKE